MQEIIKETLLSMSAEYVGDNIYKIDGFFIKILPEYSLRDVFVRMIALGEMRKEREFEKLKKAN